MQEIKKYIISLKAVLLFSVLAFSVQAHAQGISVNAQMDSTLIFIGGQIDLKLEVSQPEGVQVNFPVFADTIVAGVEIVNQTGVDTLVKNNQQVLLQQTFRITSFDSGLYYIPPIEFELAAGEAKEIAKTQPMSLNVVNPFESVDPEKGVMDIKMPVNTPFHFSEIINYIYMFLIGGVIVVGLVFLILYLTKKKTPLDYISRPKPKLPSHVIALEHLDKVKEEKLWQRGMVKEYYSEVTEAIRIYIEDRFNIPAMEQTTDEIIEAFKYIQVGDKNGLQKLHQILSTADFVKFAKMEPSYEENEQCLVNAYAFVNNTKITVEVIEEESTEKVLFQVDKEIELTKGPSKSE